MYYRDHGLPHFHAKYGSATGVFSLPDLQLIEGHLPKRVIALVLEWAFEHRQELLDDWELTKQNKPTKKIDPLV